MFINIPQENRYGKKFNFIGSKQPFTFPIFFVFLPKGKSLLLGLNSFYDL